MIFFVKLSEDFFVSVVTVVALAFLELCSLLLVVVIAMALALAFLLNNVIALTLLFILKRLINSSCSERAPKV